ncbi:putative RDD family membrane protein YckC [Bacillus mesophilus]|uniref:RDD family protein n=1 Tax=Bacillus mesophilus TaxID=1808955 RepID=A0A6M0QCP5_9BACI|nr:RDD family protein [Bacillus mesophilus]MBM7662910.1 putative RDD family membrane protein YckC [Bacillus mesophilus]NEY73499.1 RDD family protein [Bacillus mesophilus]
MCDNPGGFWVRLGAAILDGILLFIVSALLNFALFQQFVSEPNNITHAIDLLYYLLLPVFWYGYTVGKRALGIRIARVDGRKVGIGTMLMRNFVAGIAYLLTLGIGVIVSAFMVGLREDKRSIHDFIAGTYVTYDKPE